MDDARLLAVVLASRNLPAGEREAFTDMQKRLERWSALTDRQRQWVQGTAARLGVSVGDPGPLPPRRVSAWDPEPRRVRVSR